MNLVHLLDQRRRPAGVSKPPAGHGEGLGKTVQHHGPFPHPGKRGDGGVLFAVIGQFTIDFVGNHQQIVLDNQRRDGREVSPGHDDPGRIIRIGKNQRSCFRRDALFKHLRAQAKAVADICFYRNGHPAGQRHAGSVADIAGVRNQHLIPGPYAGPQGQINALAGPDRHQDFFVRVVFHMHSA